MRNDMKKKNGKNNNFHKVGWRMGSALVASQRARVRLFAVEHDSNWK